MYPFIRFITSCTLQLVTYFKIDLSEKAVLCLFPLVVSYFANCLVFPHTTKTDDEKDDNRERKEDEK